MFSVASRALWHLPHAFELSLHADKEANTVIRGIAMALTTGRPQHCYCYCLNVILVPVQEHVRACVRACVRVCVCVSRPAAM